MAGDGRVSTGVAGLDRMLGGGLLPGRPYMVTGETGSGKTLLGLRFLIEGIRNGEEVLMVAVDEPPTEIMENVQSFGWDLSAIRTLDANPGTHGLRRLADVQEIRSLGNLKSMGTLGAEGRRAPDTGDEISLQSVYLKLRQQMSGVQVQPPRGRLAHLPPKVRAQGVERPAGGADRNPVAVPFPERAGGHRTPHLGPPESPDYDARDHAEPRRDPTHAEVDR